MGSTIGSILQGIGSTGEDVGKADIANTQLQHQFTMDYLARQNASRQLDIESQGQRNTLELGKGAQDIQRQQLAQSRWQLLPGYQRMPNPKDPTSTIYRYTFTDPITKQQTFTDLDTPPPGSPEYNFNSYKFLKDQANKSNLDIPDSALLNLAYNGKIDTESDKNMKYVNLYNVMAKQPGGVAYLNKKYPAGLAQFTDEMNQLDEGKSGYEHMQFLMNNPGVTWSGQSVVPQADKLLETSLTQAQKAYESQLKAANDTLTKLGWVGTHTQPDVYASAVSSRDEATKNLDDIRARLGALNSRVAGAPQPAKIDITKQPTFNNPPVNTPAKTLSQAAIAQAAKDHGVSVEVATQQAIAAGYNVQKAQ